MKTATLTADRPFFTVGAHTPPFAADFQPGVKIASLGRRGWPPSTQAREQRGARQRRQPEHQIRRRLIQIPLNQTSRKRGFERTSEKYN
jgi:hypothetical protein